MFIAVNADRTIVKGFNSCSVMLQVLKVQVSVYCLFPLLWHKEMLLSCSWGELGQRTCVVEEQEISSVTGAQLQSLAGEGPAHKEGTASLLCFWSPYTEHSLLHNFFKMS